MPPFPIALNEEQRALLTFLLTLRLDRVRKFLGRHGITRSGNRAYLRERLEENLADGMITIDDIVDFLDEVEPWAKQHVFLYTGGDGLVGDWEDIERLRTRLREAGYGDLLDARLPVVLPEEATLSAITVTRPTRRYRRTLSLYTYCLTWIPPTSSNRAARTACRSTWKTRRMT
jgi:hypothetical protein